MLQNNNGSVAKMKLIGLIYTYPFYIYHLYLSNGPY